MSDLVKRLRGLEVNFLFAGKAADRIEQLERELALYKESAEHSLVYDENLRDQLAAEKARLSDDEEYQGYRAVNVDGQLYVHTQAHDDAWLGYKAEKALADDVYDAWEVGECIRGSSASNKYRKARGL